MSGGAVCVQCPDDEVVVVDSPQSPVTVVAPVASVVDIITPGPKGDKGDKGDTGAQGAPGVGGDLNFTFTQAMPADTWVVTHSLGKYPSVTVVDSGGATVVGDVTYNTINQCTLVFASEFSGTAYLN